MAASPRSRFVDIDSDVLLTELADDDVTFELFDDVTVVFGDLGELTVGADGNETWSATAATATATLSFAADGVRGSIQTGATTYSIVPVDGATHLLFEEGRSFPPTEEPLVPPAEPTWANDAPAAPGSIGEFTAPPSAGDGAPVVRVLTVFDDLSSAYYGGDGNAVAELTATIDEVNAAYARSGVNLVMQSAAIERVGYASSQAAGAELTRITNPGDGILDGVNQRRDALGADLVVLVTPLGLTRRWGLVWPGLAPAGLVVGRGVRFRRGRCRVRPGEPHVRPRDGPQPGRRPRAERRPARLQQRLHQPGRRLSDDHGVRRPSVVPRRAPGCRSSRARRCSTTGSRPARTRRTMRGSSTSSARTWPPTVRAACRRHSSVGRRPERRWSR